MAFGARLVPVPLGGRWMTRRTTPRTVAGLALIGHVCYIDNLCPPPSDAR